MSRSRRTYTQYIALLAFPVSSLLLSGCLTRVDDLGSAEFLFSSSLTCTLTNDCSSTQTVVDAPTFSPGAGLYNAAQNVDISSATSGALICYTTTAVNPACDNTPVCTTGTPFVASIPVATTTTIRAIACDGVLSNSSVSVGTFTIDTVAPAVVTLFSATAGDTQINLTWTNPVDADLAGIRIVQKTGSYPANVTDGTIIFDTAGSAHVDTGLVNGTQYYYTAFAYDDAANYAVGVQATATPIAGTANAPSYTPSAGLFNATQNVSLASTTPSVTMCYTTDGSAPTCDASANCTNGTTYSAAVAISATTTLRSIACRIGYIDSGITTGVFTIDLIPPGNVSGVSATPSDAFVDLAWTNPGDADFAGVRIVRKTGGYASGPTDGTATIVFDAAGTAFSDTGLTNATTYYYTLYAFDNAGNFAAGIQITAIPLAPPGGALWARTVSGGGGNASYFVNVATNSAGESYAVGYVVGTTAFNFGGGATVTGVSTGENPVIVKYDPSGGALWARSITAGDSSADTTFVDVALDSSGNVYVVGKTDNTASITYFDPGMVAIGFDAGAPVNGFLVKYDSSGTPLWVVGANVGNSEQYDFLSVTADPSGDIFVAGYQYDTTTINYGAVSLTGPISGGFNQIIVKYNSAGTALSGRTLVSGSVETSTFTITSDSSGNIYHAAYQYGGGTFDYGNGITLTSYDNTSNGTLIRYDSSLIPQWGKIPQSGALWSEFYGLTVNPAGNVCIAGYLDGPSVFNFGSGVTATANAVTSSMIICFTAASGVPQWARVDSSTAQNDFRGLTSDTLSNLIAVGEILNNGTHTYGTGVSVAGSSTSTNPVIVKYNNAGTALWALSSVTGTDYTHFYAVGTDSTNNIYVVGYQGTGLYGYGAGVTATGPSAIYNAVIVKYAP